MDDEQTDEDVARQAITDYLGARAESAWELARDAADPGTPQCQALTSDATEASLDMTHWKLWNSDAPPLYPRPIRPGTVDLVVADADKAEHDAKGGDSAAWEKALRKKRAIRALLSDCGCTLPADPEADGKDR